MIHEIRNIHGVIEHLWKGEGMKEEINQELKYCDRNICVSNEYNNIGCDECEVTKSQNPKTGHWIPIYQGDEIINYRCSECELGDTSGSTNLYGWDYCRRCGARMVEP